MFEEILNDGGKLTFSLIFLIIIIDTIVLFFIYNARKKFVNNAIKQSVKITELQNVQNVERAHISFKDRLGKTITTSVSLPLKKFLQNDMIEILYDKDHPEKVLLNVFQSLWLPYCILGGGIFTMTIFLMVLTFTGVVTFPIN